MMRTGLTELIFASRCLRYILYKITRSLQCYCSANMVLTRNFILVSLWF